MSKSTPEYLILGRILRPQGLHGIVRAGISYHDPKQLLTFTNLWLHQKSEWKKYGVKKSECRNNFWYLSFEQIDSIDKAETLRGQDIAVPFSLAPPLPASAYFHYQLLGMEVIDSSGKNLGTVMNVVNHKAVDFLLLGGEEMKTVPLSDTVIDKVDEENRKIVLKVNYE